MDITTTRKNRPKGRFFENLSACGDSSTDSKIKKRGGDPPHRGTPYSPWTCPDEEHPTHCEPAPQPNTLLTLDLPTAEHPTHGGPRQLRTNWTCLTWNSLLTQRKL